MKLIFILLFLFQIKHFLADYILQVPYNYFLGKFKLDNGWILPLTAHCLIHAYFTLIICIITLGLNDGYTALLPCLDFIIHFIMDRFKASPKLLGRFKNISKADFENYYDKLQSLNTWLNENNRIRYPATFNSIENKIDDLKSNWRESVKSNKYFWISLGFDQLIHHLTHYWLIYLIMTKLLKGF